MTYTAKQLQGMSDHTINHALYHKLFQAGVSVPDITPNYCNNPNDIMPLAFERKITIGPLMRTCGKTWIASFSYGLSYEDTNPLRAIACLLLMMED